ncbi:MAG TPA: protein-disulfide reductase DsbD N-terminal domain-containing protein [Candidatus Binataceae bacterium]|nr:protein-disulfide reductase DsbD N-terminal domain-containing protein [Candidatus Binataceae bacterium]
MTRYVHALAATALLAAATHVWAASSADLLDPTDAFRLSVAALDAHHVEVRFRIAKGYYMYRDRFRFETEAGRPIAGAALPRGEIKSDPFFGRTEIYRDQVRIGLPLPDVDLARRSVKLKIVSQGCADVGVCYVPQEQWVRVGFDPNASVEPSPDAKQPPRGIEFLLHGGSGSSAPSSSPPAKSRP